MVVCPADHGLQADVIFVIEATAVNGAYINDLKTNYILPSLEYFSQGNVDDINYISENANCLYGIVVYHAADCLPSPSSDTIGPFSSPSKLLTALDKLELIGGKSESHANIGEGLATALSCFEELGQKRDATSNAAVQKHCILICHSPPYLIPVLESHSYSGKNTEQLAGLLQDNGINLSVISPRKIPSLYKLFEKAGGDLSVSQTKNYAKDPRHLVLLKGFSLKERPLTPPSGPVTSSQNQLSASNPIQIVSLPSPIAQNDSPIPGNQQQGLGVGVTNMMGQNPNQNPNQVGNNFRPNTPQGITALQQSQQTIMMNQVRGGMMGNQQFPNQPMQAPPGYNQTMAMGGMGAQRPQRGWMMPPQQPQQRPPFMQGNTGQGGQVGQVGQVGQNQGSALIAQLTQPPNSMPNAVNQFNQLGQQQQLNNPQQPGQQIRMGLLTPQQQINQQQMNQQQQLNQQQQQLNQQQQLAQQQVQQQQQQQAQQQQQNIQPSMANVPPGVNVSQGQLAGPNVSNVGPGTMQQAMPIQQQAQNNQPIAAQGQPGGGTRQNIWQGVLEWIEKPKVLPDSQKITKQVNCTVSAGVKDGELELKADGWPPKLIMQLMPKQLIGNIGGAYLKNSKSVFFHPMASEALESLTKVMSTGFAGCVHFTGANNQSACDIKVLILLYTAEKRAYLGFIPNDQAAFVDRLRKVIQQQKSTQIMRRVDPSQGMQPGQSVQGPGIGIPPQMPNTSTPQSQNQTMMMVQKNTMTMGGGQLTQNVVTSSSQSQQNISGQMMNPNMPGVAGVPGGMRLRMPLPNQNQQQVPPNQTMTGNSQQGMMGAGNRPQGGPYTNHLEVERQANLDKISQLKQTLEVAQQQEQQYKNQLERISHMKTQQLQEALQMAQQQEMHYKMLDQQRMNKVIPSANCIQPQRMMLSGPGGPQVLSNNPGLRTLLQQQPQYRPQMMGNQMHPNMGGNMQQGGPRPTMDQQMGQQQGNNQVNFDEVTNFDYFTNN